MKAKYSRFKKYMEYKGLYDNKVARECNIAQSIFYQAKKGKSDLGEKTLEKIFDKYKDLNRVWVLTGEGSMISKEQNQKPENEQRVTEKKVSGDINNTNTNYHNNYYNDNNNCKNEKTEVNFLEILHEQLKEKDKQIAEKDKQLAEKDWQIRQIITMNTK